MKKTFPCGHKGKGQYCHLCEQKNRKMAQRVAARVERREKEQSIRESLGIDIKGLPLKVAENAKCIMDRIASGEPYMRFRGKRLDEDRTIISIPVTGFYRMVCKDVGGCLVPTHLLSHEDYNRVFKKITK